MLDAFATLSDPSTALDNQEVDLEALLARSCSDSDPGGAMARAMVGLLIVATLEGQAKKHRPQDAFPSLSVRLVRSMCLPVARLLIAADAYSSAATLSALVRDYMMCDPMQRQEDKGRLAIAESRTIEAEWALHRHRQAQHAAWSLYDGFAQDPVRKACVAALFFAVGDVLRAQAIREGHVPSLASLVDLVEISLELAPVDPLLQGVWLLTLGETQADVSETVRFTLRAIRPEINSAFKGVEEFFKRHRGMTISTAYAVALLTYLSGQWGNDLTDHLWWQILGEALELPTFAHDYRSGLLRLVEVYNLGLLPGDPVPLSELIAAMSGREGERSDLREVAALSLEVDEWTRQRGQVGRSLAYDSAFIIEPSRRSKPKPEPVEKSIELLEAHRCAGLRYWLYVVPPLTRRAGDDHERDAVAVDKTLTAEYRALAFLGTMQEAPLYVRVYGHPNFKSVLPTNMGVRLEWLMDCDRLRREWFENVLSLWPEYADAAAHSTGDAGQCGRSTRHRLNPRRPESFRPPPDGQRPVDDPVCRRKSLRRVIRSS